MIRSLSGGVRVNPELMYGWCAQSQLVVNNSGECNEQQVLSGYWHRETRYVRTLHFSINGRKPWLCQAAAVSPTLLLFDFVYPELERFGGGGSGQADDAISVDADGIPYRALGVRVRYELLIDRLSVACECTNRALTRQSFEITWALEPDYADLLEAHSAERKQTAELRREQLDGELLFRYLHPDLPFSTRVHCGDWRVCDGGISTTLDLNAGESKSVRFAIEPVDFMDHFDRKEAAKRAHMLAHWRQNMAQMEMPSNALAQRIFRQQITDIASFPLLDGARDEWLTMQAGMPLYPALFGRDTITAGWQCAVIDQGEALDASLTRLGRMQSHRVDAWHDEEPGRIPFQVRRGPLARLGDNPFGAYYADFASPLMFVISLAHLYAWTGEKACLERHWDVARRILDWARDYGDRDGDGYLEYLTQSTRGTKNQGWKDSGDAIIYEDGTPVPAPLGTCELQGYWYAAQQMFAVLSVVMGEHENARAYWDSAAELKHRFNADWWLDGDDCPAVALDADKRFVHAVSSNAGHCLATGIVSDEHLPPLVGRLFAPDMFSGWGIRTLSGTHRSYDPISYHRGSVWAVENATIVFGLRRFGFDTRAVELATAMYELAQWYPSYRVPECVGGQARIAGEPPGVYPRANTPQLWNASGFMLVLQTLLGLQPVAPLNLLVVDPVLPAWLPELVIRNLRVGGASISMRFWREDNGKCHAEVVHQRGTLHVVKQPPPESLTVGVGDRLRAFIDGIWHR